MEVAKRRRQFDLVERQRLAGKGREIELDPPRRQRQTGILHPLPLAERQRHLAAPFERQPGQPPERRQRHPPPGDLARGDPVGRQRHRAGQGRAEHVGLDRGETRPAGRGQRHLRCDPRPPVIALEQQQRRTAAALRQCRVERRPRDVDAGCRAVAEFGRKHQPRRARGAADLRLGRQRAACRIAGNIADLGKRQPDVAVHRAGRRHREAPREPVVAGRRRDIAERPAAIRIEPGIAFGRQPGRQQPVERRIAGRERPGPQGQPPAAPAIGEAEPLDARLSRARHCLSTEYPERRQIGEHGLDIAFRFRRAAAEIDPGPPGEMRRAAEPAQRRRRDRRLAQRRIGLAGQLPADRSGIAARAVEQRREALGRPRRLDVVMPAAPHRRCIAGQRQPAGRHARLGQPVAVGTGLGQPPAGRHRPCVIEETEFARHHVALGREPETEIGPLAQRAMRIGLEHQRRPGIDRGPPGHQPGQALPVDLDGKPPDAVEPGKPRQGAGPPGLAIGQAELQQAPFGPGQEAVVQIGMAGAAIRPLQQQRDVAFAPPMQQMALRGETDLLAGQRRAERHVARVEIVEPQRHRQHRQTRQHEIRAFASALGRQRPPRDIEPGKLEPRDVNLAAPQSQRPPVEFEALERRPDALGIGNADIAEPEPSGPDAAEPADLDPRLAVPRRRQRGIEQPLAQRRDVDEPQPQRDRSQPQPEREQQHGQRPPHRHPSGILCCRRHQKACPSDT